MIYKTYKIINKHNKTIFVLIVFCFMYQHIKQRKERQKKQQKTYTTTTAGIYVSEILNRNKPLSKVSINDRIKNGQLRSEKVGNRNIIYQNDLDDFIKKYGDTIRN